MPSEHRGSVPECEPADVAAAKNCRNLPVQLQRQLALPLNLLQLRGEAAEESSAAPVEPVSALRDLWIALVLSPARLSTRGECHRKRNLPRHSLPFPPQEAFGASAAGPVQ